MAAKVMNCDLLVLGAGGTSLVAAVKAADDTGKKVIVLEKTKKPGGATTFMHVFPIKDSKWQKEAGETISNPPSMSGQFFDWLVTKGGAEEYFKMAKPGDRGASIFGTVSMYKIMEKYKDRDDPSIGPGWTGTYIVEKMLECCKKMGIPVVTRARAKKFITDATGKVTGVLADTADGELQVNCKACYMGMGGFGSDYERCKKIWPGDFNNKPMMRISPPSHTGDWIDMATEIGAKVDLETAFIELAGGVHHPYSYSIFSMILKKETMAPRPEWLVINLNGERWSWPTHRIGGIGYTGKVDAQHKVGSIANPDPLSNLPGAAIYVIGDQRITDMIGERMVADDWDMTAIPLLKKWREHVEYEASLDDSKISHGNHTKKANTLEELALKMAIDPKVFLATVERYNKLCDGGKDLDFGKDPAALIPIRNPPYYAFWAHRFSQTTNGGIMTNNKMEVLDTKGKPMPGLYAGGQCATSPSGLRDRVGTIGYIAGIQVGNYLKSLG